MFFFFIIHPLYSTSLHFTSLFSHTLYTHFFFHSVNRCCCCCCCRRRSRRRCCCCCHRYFAFHVINHAVLEMRSIYCKQSAEWNRQPNNFIRIYTTIKMAQTIKNASRAWIRNVSLFRINSLYFNRTDVWQQHQHQLNNNKESEKVEIERGKVSACAFY